MAPKKGSKSDVASPKARNANARKSRTEPSRTVQRRSPRKAQPTVNSEKSIAEEREQMDALEVTKERKRKGKVTMQRIQKIKNTGQKIEIQYNAKGQMRGQGRIDLTGYVGQLVRRYIPITFDDWRDKDLKGKKDMIWELVEVTLKNFMQLLYS